MSVFAEFDLPAETFALSETLTSLPEAALSSIIDQDPSLETV